MSKRKYIKRSDYWKKFDKGDPDTIQQHLQSSNTVPISSGEPYYVESTASYNRAAPAADSTVGRRNAIHKKDKDFRFANIASGLLPYTYSADGVDVRQAIELCQKAYANVSVFRNAVDVMSEFANSNLYLEGGTKKSQDFIYKWFEKINLWNLKDQYFREYYRSGNIFLYRVDGEFSKADFEKLSKIYGSFANLTPGKLPVRYVLLNPYDIVATKSSSFETGIYEKLLSEFDLERLRNPKTEYDEEIFNSLDPDIKEKIRSGQYSADGLKVKLESDKLLYSFYKKQDYEPFAIPFGFPVLDDINFKIELKKIDQAICRTIENVILLITMGAEPEKGGINPNNMQAMQNLFQNESVGRVLVSDFTTKAQFVIPDISKVVGPSKYEVINNDIKEGLQNIIVGDERYSNTQVKAQIFLERLKESRNAFLYDFLQPQIKMVCKNLGFRKYPIVKFEETDIKDEVQLQRVATRLMELGILTPEQGVNVLNKGAYPNPEELAPAQRQFVEQRKEGMYNPIVGGVPMLEEDGGPVSAQDSGDTPQEVGRPVGTSDIPQENSSASGLYSREDLQATIYDTEKLKEFAYAQMKESSGKKRLSKSQKALLDELCKSVIISEEKDNWEGSVACCVEDSSKIGSLGVLPQISDIAVEHGLDQYSASLLYHSKN